MSRQTEFLQKVQSSFDRVLIYEQAMLQQQARSCMPLEEFQYRSMDKAKRLGLGPEHLKDLVLVELLDWFKNSFFKWVDTPECENEDCKGKKRTHVGNAIPTSDEAIFEASRVEEYRCEGCGRTIRFPRFNHPGHLLRVRKGRCGEWANCFTLCCRALGYDARYVLDWTDHVWTEVFSDNQKRWLHCDPCENVCDKPLLYEVGWGKRLTYVFALSRDDIQDVTWRYSAKHAEVLRRRNEVPESWLVGRILALRNNRQSTLNPQRKQYLLERTVQELAEMLIPRSGVEEELPGRSTGSLEWRMARGELGTTSARPTSNYAIVPKEEEIGRKVIRLAYSCASDLYVRGEEKITGWTSLLYDAKNVTRKVEHDWNMVYLARVEGSPDAFVTWKVDLNSCAAAVDTVKVEVHSACYGSGRVLWELGDNDGRTVSISSGKQNVVTELRNSKVLMLTATLTDGDGALAWQHTQLFRQKRSPQSGEDLEWPFSISVTLK